MTRKPDNKPMLNEENKMTRLNTSRKLLWTFYIALFAFMLLCNVLTLKLSDDYAYLYSWADDSLITNPLQIIPSMAAHTVRMNGRLVAHGVAQFWLMLPGWMFDIANSLVFVLQIPLIVRICKGKNEERNNLLHVAIFCAIWVTELAFGQANLWLDGACNYLWSVVAGLLFILPYVSYFMSDDTQRGTLRGVLFLILSVAMGGWAESGSAACIFIAAVLLALGHFWQRKPMSYILVAGIVLAVAGYLTIYMAPAQMNKGSAMSLMSLLAGVLRCLLRLTEIWVLVAAFVLMLFLSVYNGTDRKRLVLAGVFFLGAMCANFILIFASFYPERVAISTTVLLICADAVLAQTLFAKGTYKTAIASVLILLVLTAPASLFRGVKDIYETFSTTKQNEEYLYQCAENGVMDVLLPIHTPSTKYSALYDLRYLVTDDPNDWPNNAMARYYGVDTILGIAPEYILP